MDLDVRHLRVVAGISEAGSMTRAAAGLHLTQSALSHTLRDIESRFGTPFFLRLGKRMVLTPAGQIVLEAATTVFAELRRTEEEVRRIAGQIDPVIRVCTQCNTAYHWLAPLLAICNRKHPRVTINIVADATDRPVEAMLAGRLDLAILTSDSKDRRLRQRTLFTDEMVAIVSRAHPLAGRGWLTPQELARQHLLLYTSSREQSWAFRSVLVPAKLEPERVSFIMLTEAMIEMAKAGLGVGILPRWSAEAAIASRSVVPLSITRRGLRRQWRAATLKAQPDSPALTDFITLLAERAIPVRHAAALRRATA